MKLDAGEVSTVSSAAGNYTISAPPSSACVLRAEVPSSAIDSDTGGAIGKSYTMSAISGRPGVISPLTTAVEMGAISEAQLNQYLPGVSLGSDYIALGDAGKNAHNAARFYSVLLQSIGGVIKTDDVTTRSDLIKSGLGMISNNVYLGGGDLDLYKNLLPVASGFKLASSSLVKYSIEINDNALQGDDGSKRRVIEAAVASIKKNPQAVAGGNVYWGVIPMADKAWAQNIHPDAGIFQDSAQAQALRKIIFDLSDKARSEIDAEKKKVDKKLLSVALKNSTDMFSTSVGSAFKLLPSAALINNASIPGSKLVRVKKAKDIARNIKRLLPVFAKIPSECGNFLIGLDKFIGPLANDNFDFKDAYDLMVETTKCGAGIMGADEVQHVVGIINAGVTVNGSKDADVLGVAQGFSDLISIICDIGGAQTVSAVWDETIGMFIKSLVALEEINQAGDKAMDAFEAATNIVINNLMKDQFEVGSALLSARVSPYLMIVPVYHADDSSAKDGSLVGKSVTAIAPISAVMGQGMTFTITGQNLPLTPTITLGGIPCQIQSSPAPTASGFTAVCTPGGAAGNQVVKISDSAGNVIDQSKSVTVTSVSLPTPVFTVRFDQANLASLGGVTSTGGVSYISGKDGRPAAKFSGVTAPGHIKISNRDSLKFVDGATFDMWVYMDSMTGMDGWGSTVRNGAYAMALVAKSHDRSGGVMLANSFTDANTSLWHAGIGSWNSCKHIPYTPVALGTWARVTYVFSSTSGTYAYLNKNLVWECAGDRPNFGVMNTQDMYIGKFSDSWYPFSGAIQDLNVYSKALSSAQVSALQ